MKAGISTLLDELLNAIRKERQFITALEHEKLLSLLPKKLALLEQIEKLCSGTDDLKSLLQDEEIERTLKVIKKENELNKVFVEEMSSVYDDFWTAVMPGIYNSKGRQEHISATTKGTNFSVEA